MVFVDLVSLVGLVVLVLVLVLLVVCFVQLGHFLVGIQIPFCT